MKILLLKSNEEIYKEKFKLKNIKDTQHIKIDKKLIKENQILHQQLQELWEKSLEALDYTAKLIGYIRQKGIIGLALNEQQDQLKSIKKQLTQITGEKKDNIIQQIETIQQKDDQENYQQYVYPLYMTYMKDTIKWLQGTEKITKEQA